MLSSGDERKLKDKKGKVLYRGIHISMPTRTPCSPTGEDERQGKTKIVEKETNSKVHSDSIHHVLHLLRPHEETSRFRIRGV